MIIDQVGTPTEADISQIQEQKIRDFLRGIPIRPPKKLEKLFPKANPLAIDLLQKQLTFDVKKRATIDKSLDHPYMKNLHFSEDEPTGPVVSKGDFEFEMYDLTKEQLKDLIYEEILLYHFPEVLQEHQKNVKEGRSTMKWILENENKNYIDIDDSDEEDYE